MDDSMRKILYYESVLEFKELSASPLLISDVKNWELCCTCLREPDPDATKICVIGNNGNYLTIKEMIKSILNEELLFQDEEANRICRECLNKITSLYFFKHQIQRARSLLIRLKEKVAGTDHVDLTKEAESPTMIQDSQDATPNSTNTAIEISEEITIVGFENKNNDAFLKHESLDSSEDNLQIVDVHEIDDFLDERLSEDEGDVHSDTMDYYEEQELIDNIELNENANKEGEENESTDVPKNKRQANTEGKKQQKNYKRKVGPRRPRIAKVLLENNKCELCDIEFNMQRSLVEHVRDEHPNTRAFKCLHCNKRFGHLQSLSRHIQAHRPDPKSICCEHCGRCFKRSDDLKRHMRIHTGERPYQCPDCEKSFKQHSELSAHRQSHSALKKYECDICGHVLLSRNGMYVHKKTHTGITKHQCVYCIKDFLTNAELQAHMSIHIEKRSSTDNSQANSQKETKD